MEDYKEKYEMALEGVQEILSSGQDSIKMPQLQLRLQGIFPELKNEDEKIRKALVRFHKSTIDIDGIKGADIIAWLEKQGNNTPTIIWHNIDEKPEEMKELFCEWESDDATWHDVAFYDEESHTFRHAKMPINVTKWVYVDELLEKQCEQKPVLDFKASNWYVSKVDGKIHDMTYNPVDKVEPKFHKGEWIVWKNKCYKVNYNGCGYELIDQNGLSTSLEYGTVDTSARLYDVTKDAKDGDVLISQYGNPFIYNGNYNSLHIGAYCGITCDDNKFKVAEEKCHWTENVDIKPATKEQRDTLMKAMADAGYTFDFDKKEPKKIEDGIEIPFGAKDSELQEATYYIPDGFHAEIDDDKVVIKKGEKSAAWSEEDEEMLRSCTGAIWAADYYLYEDKQDMEAWLKSIKNRIGG